MDIFKEVRNLGIQNGLSRAQILALEVLKSEFSEEYQNVSTHGKGSPSFVVRARSKRKDLSGREMKGTAENGTSYQLIH